MKTCTPIIVNHWGVNAGAMSTIAKTVAYISASVDAEIWYGCPVGRTKGIYAQTNYDRINHGGEPSTSNMTTLIISITSARNHSQIIPIGIGLALNHD